MLSRSCSSEIEIKCCQVSYYFQTIPIFVNDCVNCLLSTNKRYILPTHDFLLNLVLTRFKNIRRILMIFLIYSNWHLKVSSNFENILFYFRSSQIYFTSIPFKSSDVISSSVACPGPKILLQIFATKMTTINRNSKFKLFRSLL